MKVELFPFQKKALLGLRIQSAEAMGSFHRTYTPQVVSFTAPTGAGKTLIMAALFEEIFYGDADYPDQHDAIFVWLSDSPELNEQSKRKIDLKADKITLSRSITIDDASFDQEFLDDGHIYFINTQKLGKNSNLIKHGDTRQYTIWETLQNTVKEKSDRLYFVIDEAHRGMQGREASKATTIMQKFIKGSEDDGLGSMPVVIGITATPERFNNLVASTTSTIHKVIVTADEVRASGLLKDRIVITYPEDSNVNKDMAVFQAAVDDWKDKWEHWYQYCFEQHYAYVNPVLVVQVENGTGTKLSATDLDDCIQKFEERTNLKLLEGEVVHTFGQTSGAITVHGLTVPYIEPSNIAEDKRIKVVFFKENLSTGWDCPRAETMMSFRHASDATYIAQLLGRMVRTPMQMHIQVDDTLNDVHLYLPYFDEVTVENVADALQNAEGGFIPADVYGESLEGRVLETLSVHPKASNEGGQRPVTQTPGQMSLFDFSGNQINSSVVRETSVSYGSDSANQNESKKQTGVAFAEQTTQTYVSEQNNPLMHAVNTESTAENMLQPDSAFAQNIQPSDEETLEETIDDGIDREGIMKAINDSGLLSYDVRNVRIANYLTSLYALSRLLTQSNKCPEATDTVINDVVKMIREYVTDLQGSGKYESLAKKVMQFKLNTQIYDAFGESINNELVHFMMSTTDIDIDRQFRRAETRLGSEGVGICYGRCYYDENDPNAYKIDVILFAADDDCVARLNVYAEKMFHQLNDKYRRKMVGMDERFLKQYNNIVSDGDIVSKHNFKLPEIITQPKEINGKDYTDHLFVDDTGTAKINLNNWEEGVLEEEQSQVDFVCWLRNPPRKSWSLCIPYEMGGEQKPAYPDFVIIRRDADSNYIIDILEPHDPTRIDNLGKAKGFAEYARQNPEVGRIQLIRMGKDAAGKNRFKRLDMAMSLVRDKVSRAMTNDELDHIFEIDGFFM